MAAAHNRGSEAGLPGMKRALTRAALLLLQAWLAGCTTASPPPSVTVSQLASAPSVRPLTVVRARLGYDRPLPARLTQCLSEEFSLITIRNAQDWLDVTRRLHLEAGLHTPDFTTGCVIGILASVGEQAQGRWPLHIRRARVEAGYGSIEAYFQSGIYYPLLTASYLTLADVPRLQTVVHVRINQRVFVLPAAPKPPLLQSMLLPGNAVP